MMRKCQYCDEAREKSINTDVDDYIKLKKAFYSHVDCYKIHLKTKKKMDDKSIDAEIKILKNKMIKDQQNQQDKENFINYITKYYNITLSKWQYNKLANVNNGTYNSNMKEGISYYDLLEMWSNQKFQKKLEKIAYNKNLDSTNRFDYDLSIVVGEYDKYKKSKIRKFINENQAKELFRQKDLTRRTISKLESDDKQEEEVDIFDMLD